MSARIPIHAGAKSFDIARTMKPFCSMNVMKVFLSGKMGSDLDLEGIRAFRGYIIVSGPIPSERCVV